MSLLESGENYLEAILRLSKKQLEIHAIDIVNALGFSKPSVSIALKKLKRIKHSLAYSEQVGIKRHFGGVLGDIFFW